MNDKKFKAILKSYDKRYEFRLCEESEYLRLIDFLDKYWHKNHVLATSKNLMDWQYLDKKNHVYNFVLAIERETDEIHGILGFIKTDFFDSSITLPMRWGAIWKVREDVAVRGLGLAMKLYMYNHIKAPYAGGIGLSRFSREINKKMGEEMGKLNHFYMINSNCSSYHLLKNVRSEYFSPENFDSNKEFHFCDIDEFQKKNQNYWEHLLPYKSKEYYLKRFLKHPFYKYQCIEIRDENGEANAAFFIRICEHDGARCIMIVDFVGDARCFKGTQKCFENLLNEMNAEYLSFYEYGLSDEVLYEAGLRKYSGEELILPCYYEPFEQVNVDIDFHYFNSENVSKALYFFKGDADQDRPNIL